MGIALANALVAFALAHGVLVAGLARRHGWTRALLALVVPPLAAWWGWNAGLRRPVIAWGAALALYAALVVAA